MTVKKSDYGEALTGLIDRSRVMPLGPGRPEADRIREISSLNIDKAFPGPVKDRDMARACFSGLFLLYDGMDASHEISQAIETPTGSYWHGILHRREPDYSNAGYWFRRVGHHPVYPWLKRRVGELAADFPETLKWMPSEEWDALRFVDRCEEAAAKEGRLTAWCLEVQKIEWNLLFDYCFARAMGENA